MPLNVACQMDPIDRIDIRGDSTFALLLEAQRRGHELFYYTPPNLALLGGRLLARGSHADGRGQGRRPLPRCPTRAPRTSPTWDVVLLRQDPPFDMAYITTTHLLERIHPKTLVVNDPGARAQRAREGVRARLPRPDAADAGDAQPRGREGASAPSTRTSSSSRSTATAAPPCSASAPDDTNLNSLVELFQTVFREPFMVQQYRPEVRGGDKRIILVDGEVAGAINRVPAADETRSNMHVGGVADGRPS